MPITTPGTPGCNRAGLKNQAAWSKCALLAALGVAELRLPRGRLSEHRATTGFSKQTTWAAIADINKRSTQVCAEVQNSRAMSLTLHCIFCEPFYPALGIQNKTTLSPKFSSYAIEPNIIKYEYYQYVYTSSRKL